MKENERLATTFIAVLTALSMFLIALIFLLIQAR
jgi:hypothetical protein